MNLYIRGCFFFWGPQNSVFFLKDFLGFFSQKKNFFF